MGQNKSNIDQKTWITNHRKSRSEVLQRNQKWDTPSAIGDQNRGTLSVHVILDLGTLLAASWAPLGDVMEGSW